MLDFFDDPTFLLDKYNLTKHPLKKAGEPVGVPESKKEVEEKKEDETIYLTDAEVEKFMKRPEKACHFCAYVLKNLTKTDKGWTLSEELLKDEHLIENIEHIIGRDFYKEEIYSYENEEWYKKWKARQEKSGGKSGWGRNLWQTSEDFIIEDDLEFPPEDEDIRAKRAKKKSDIFSGIEEIPLEEIIYDLAKKGNLKELRKLADSYDDIPLYALDYQEEKDGGKSALHWAALKNNYEMLVTLLDLGCSVDVEDDNGDTPLSEACARNNLKIAKELLDRDAWPTLSSPKKLPIISAVKNNNPKLVELLIKNGADIDEEMIDNGGIYVTPLWIACLKKNLNMIELLLLYKAEVYEDLFKLPFTDEMIELFKKHNAWLPSD